ncbi:MAG: glycosyltransferase 87 family protein [Corynebacterium sp.]|nr:glycosyltransferase 87 family protein [Corynebacterium sp.]
MRLSHPASALLLILAVAGAGFIFNYLYRALTGTHIDAQVYQAAGQAWLSGEPLYGPAFTSSTGLSAFIYPPFAALVFALLAPLPPMVVVLLLQVGTYVALWLINFMILRRAGQPLSVVWLCFFVCCVFHPVRILSELGQVDILLLCLVVADVCGFLPRWARGLGVGLAAGFKLSPAFFGMIFLVRAQWAAVFRSALAFFATVLGTALLNPAYSKAFWLGHMNDVAVVNPVLYFRNQSLRGFLARSGLPESTADSISTPIFVAFLLVALIGVFLLRHERSYTLSLLLVCLCIYVGSPIANVHNWVGVILFAPLLWEAKTLLPKTIIFFFICVYALSFNRGPATLSSSPGAQDYFLWLWNNLTCLAGRGGGGGGGGVALLVVAFAQSRRPRLSTNA